MKMNLFGFHDENRVKCGKCGTEFDLTRNRDGCPLCGLGQKFNSEKTIEFVAVNSQSHKEEVINIDRSIEKFTQIPANLEVKEGNVISTEESKVWGSWLMFNSFFPGKLLIRVMGCEMNDRKKEYVPLYSVLKNFILVTQRYNLTKVKGFPDIPRSKQMVEAMLNELDKVSSVKRLVHHFLKTFVCLGLISIRAIKKTGKEIWAEKWENLEVSITKSGIEFAKIKNPFFDDKKNNEFIGEEERKWILTYLKKIDDRGYKEYSTFKKVYAFFKTGETDLINWFSNEKTFRDYVRQRSEKARINKDIFEKQIHNYARTFSSSKISLLRELYIIKNERGNYTLINELP